MKFNARTLLLSTALTLPAAGAAYAQEADATCDDLAQLLEQGLPADTDVSEDQINQMIEAGDDAECALIFVQVDQGSAATQEAEGTESETSTSESELTTTTEGDAVDTEDAELADTERAVVRLEDEVVIEGNVYLEDQPPTVDVEAGETEVTVNEQAPEVTVTEGQAEILIRQAAPTISVDMPQPTIRIEQPAPEIIITMPEPGVDVASVRPQVEVRQAEPVVTVTQGRPAVQLELQRAEDPENTQGIQYTDRATGETFEPGTPGEPREMANAQVNLNSPEPTVVYGNGEEQPAANVQLQRSQPTVRFESAEPQVTFSQGEPQVELVQSGEPVVRFNEANGESDDAAADTGAEGEETEAADAAAAATDPAATEEADATAAAEADATAEPTEAEQAAMEAEAAADEAGAAATEAEAMATDAEAGDATATADAEATATAETGGDMATEDGTTEDVVATEDNATMNAEQDAEGEMAAGNGPMIEREGYRMAESGEFTVDNLTGTTVYGVDDERIADVGDVVISPGGDADAVILEVGGFLGLGQKDVSIPFSDLTILVGENNDLRAYVDATEDDLKAMPDYEAQ